MPGIDNDEVAGCDGVELPTKNDVVAAATSMVERNEPLHVDMINATLASAMLAWCNRRDPKEVRRLLLELLLALDTPR